MLDLHLALMIDGESRGLSQAANSEAWNKRRAAGSTKLFITAATAVFLSTYGLYVHMDCMCRGRAPFLLA